MEIPNDYTKKFVARAPVGPRSERAEIIGLFLDHGIQIRDRRTKLLRPVEARELGVLLSHIPSADLYAFYRQCERARSFSRYFWWAIRPEGPLHAVQKGVAQQPRHGDSVSGVRGNSYQGN